MENLSIEVRQISHDENENWLNHSNVVGESRDQTSQKSPYYSCANELLIRRCSMPYHLNYLFLTHENTSERYT